MYKLICQVRLEQPTLTPEQIEDQLLFIQHNLLQLQSIARMARRNIAAAEFATKAAEPPQLGDTDGTELPRTVLTIVT